MTADLIKQVLAKYLDDERARLARNAFGNYTHVIELIEHSLNGYAYQSLDLADLECWEPALDAGNEEAYCELSQPQRRSHVRR